jgi:ABC-2 type transport system permease protein
MLLGKNISIGNKAFPGLTLVKFMRKFLVLLKYEIHKLLVSPSTYFVAAIFAAIVALIYLFTLREFIFRDHEFTFVHEFLRCFWLPTLLSVPLITMRTFSEDYKTGLLQLNKATPIGNFSIVFAKFLATYLFHAGLWATSLLFVFLPNFVAPSIAHSGSFFNTCNLIGGYAYLLLIGVPFTAIGLFFSSLTENQTLSGALTFIAILVLLLGEPLLSQGTVSFGTPIGHAFIRPLNVFLQMNSACFGVFDTRVIVLYASLGLLFLIFTKVSLEKNFS